MTSSNNNLRVTKVNSVKLENFRGWTKARTVNLDANVVIITGANGRGKSSLLEAISAGLNNVFVHSKRDSIGISNRDKPFSIKIDVCFEDTPQNTPEGQNTIELTSTDTKTGSEWSLTKNKLSFTWNQYFEKFNKQNSSTYLQSSTVFLQDDVESQFSSSDELYNFLKPRPKWFTDLKENLKRIIERLQNIEKDAHELSRTEFLSHLRKRNNLAEQLVHRLSELIGQSNFSIKDETRKMAAILNDLQELTSSKHDKDLDVTLSRFSFDLSQAEQTAETKSRKFRELEADLERTRSQILDHENKWPNAERIADWKFCDGDFETYIQLLETTSSVGNYSQNAKQLNQLMSQIPDEWKSEIPNISEVIHELPRELAKVDFAKTDKYLSVMKRWFDFWNVKKAEIVELRITLEELENQKRNFGVTESKAQKLIEELRSEHKRYLTLKRRNESALRRAEQWEKAEPVKIALDKLSAILEDDLERNLDTETEKIVSKEFNRLMCHFVIAGLINDDDAVQIKSSKNDSFDVRFKDDREKSAHFSTGQTTQTALVWLLLSNQLLQKWLPHQVVLLDDFSSTLDLTNLAAECSLIRKFAYNANLGQRRQVIITSHHDQFTRKLLDYLMPPKGFTMREISLTDWSLAEGPGFDEWEIKPARNAEDNRQEIANLIESLE